MRYGRDLFSWSAGYRAGIDLDNPILENDVNPQGKGEEMRYMGIDQHGNTYHGLVNPRKDLLERLGRQHAEKMFLDTKTGESKHCGYVIASCWISLYQVTEFESKRGGK